MKRRKTTRGKKYDLLSSPYNYSHLSNKRIIEVINHHKKKLSYSFLKSRFFRAFKDSTRNHNRNEKIKELQWEIKKRGIKVIEPKIHLSALSKHSKQFKNK
ncbi:hypothetical protein KQ51_01395 [Candidatus Izimaplasma bacterium HR1]|jgi:hypothetical protein|uniref:hypothetical protein n=1 Tax=Candidatus Izimoplasma sp. HR1 TaxID=1541959 RepID=UPI0004F6BC5A|nr:hypothetical protein KQ51_01395 [Candidatus Izimaplasma bacterium HR1]